MIMYFLYIFLNSLKEKGERKKMDGGIIINFLPSFRIMISFL